MSAAAEIERSPYVTPRLCNSQTVTNSLPSLPKLHGKTTLVTTKLCEQMYKSTTGHYFDATISREYKNPSLMEYSGLNDPHLKGYYYRKDMRKKLQQKGFVTKSLHVIVPLREYNAYRKFLENEYMKLHKPELDRRQNEQKRVDNRKKLDTKDKLEREEKRKQFFMEQEQLLKERQMNMRELETREKLEKRKVHEKKVKEKQLKEIKREVEREEQDLIKIFKKHEESIKRKKIHQKIEILKYNRIVHLQETKKKNQTKHFNALEKKWQKYEEHIEMVRQEEKDKKEIEMQKKVEKVKRRDTLFMLLQKTEEEKKLKFMKYNIQQTQQLKEQADKFEKHWKEARDKEIEECRRKLQKKEKFWQHVADSSHEAEASSSKPQVDNECSSNESQEDTEEERLQQEYQREQDAILQKLQSLPRASFCNNSNSTLLVASPRKYSTNSNVNSAMDGEAITEVEDNISTVPSLPAVMEKSRSSKKVHFFSDDINEEEDTDYYY